MSASSWKFAYSAFVYHDEPLPTSLQRVADCGYDGIELMAYPERFGEAEEIGRSVTEAGLEVCAVCATAPAELDPLAPDPRVREAALEHLRASAEFAAAVAAPRMVLAPTAAGKTVRLASREQEWVWATEALREVGEHADGLGVELVLECWNRYETYFLNRLEQAAALWRETGLANGGVMADTFHMNIEEASIADAILAAGPLLRHVHLADSNRSAPGTGHTDFGPILAALAAIGYEGYLCFELLPPMADVFGAIGAGENADFLEPFTRSSIEHVKGLAMESPGVTA